MDLSIQEKVLIWRALVEFQRINQNNSGGGKDCFHCEAFGKRYKAIYELTRRFSDMLDPG